MEVFEIIERIIGHLAWPTIVFFVFYQFKSEIILVIRRIKKAKYKNLEIDFQKTIEEIKADAEKAGVTIVYDSDYFPSDSIENIEIAPEWAFMKSWQELENILVSYYMSKSGMKTKRVNVQTVLRYLSDKGIVDDEMVMLINKLRQTRNMIVHTSDSSITRGEALEWLGISKSVSDRLDQKLRSTTGQS